VMQWLVTGFTPSDDQSFCNPCEAGKYKPSSGLQCDQVRAFIFLSLCRAVSLLGA